MTKLASLTDRLHASMGHSLLIAALCALSAAANSADIGPGDLPPPIVDVHMHIQGRDISEELHKVAARLPAEFRDLSPATLKPRSGADALRVLDEAGIQYGVLLSEAYMFFSPFAAPDHLDAARLTRQENIYVVSEAAKSKGRLIAFIGIDPLAPNALEEIAYWIEHPGARGIKLHLANSAFDYHSKGNMASLAAVFSAASAAHLPIAIHMRNNEAFGAREAKQFIDEVLPHAGNLLVQVAHGAGWGGLDQRTLDALQTFAEAIAAHRPGTQNLVFDLAVVVTKAKTDPTLAQAYVDCMRKAGIDRFRFGSDWPAVYEPKAYVARLISQLPLTLAEWKAIFSKRAPYF